MEEKLGNYRRSAMFGDGGGEQALVWQRLRNTMRSIIERTKAIYDRQDEEETKRSLAAAMGNRPRKRNN